MENMKRSILFQLISGLILALTFTSCSYDEYADAEYPETKIYQPMALETIWNIDKPTVENPSMVTPGETKRYELDKANNKFIVLLGVVQAGIELKSFTVDISVDHSIVNTMIMDRWELYLCLNQLIRFLHRLIWSLMLHLLLFGWRLI